MEFDTDILRFGYTSLTKPSSTFEYNMKEKTTVLLKQQEVLGGKFFAENYISERIWATARDGKEVAISLVYHKDTKKSTDTPLLLYGYGSYGHTVDATFSSVRLSLWTEDLFMQSLTSEVANILVANGMKTEKCFRRKTHFLILSMQQNT
jgi:oligopeptidase B